MDVAGNRAMKIMGKTARQGIDNFMDAFSEDYEIKLKVAALAHHQDFFQTLNQTFGMLVGPNRLK